MALKDLALEHVLEFSRQLAGSTNKDVDVETRGGAARRCSGGEGGDFEMLLSSALVDGCRCAFGARG